MITKLSKHHANGGKSNISERIASEILPISGQTAATIEPRLKMHISTCTFRGANKGGELATGEVAARIPQGVTGAGLYASGVITNIGTLREKGHKEPWIIAMDARPYPVYEQYQLS